ncbi:MAG: hypothetical protein AB7S97_02340 [Thermoplasmata archaeon]
MIAKVWIALALGSAFMVAGLATVAAGNMNGDCDQIQDKLQDGSCDDCPDDTAEDDVCDSCNDYEFLYGETELEPPHQSECGQE